MPIFAVTTMNGLCTSQKLVRCSIYQLLQDFYDATIERDNKLNLGKFCKISFNCLQFKFYKIQLICNEQCENPNIWTFFIGKPDGI